MKLKKASEKPKSSLNVEKIPNYTHFITLPLKFVGCWDWFPKPKSEYQIIINNVYLAIVLFVLLNHNITLIVNLYTEWVDIMSSLEKIADGLPLIVSVFIVAYFAVYKQDLYDMTAYMNANFKFYSARGLTNMTMWQSYKAAKNFANFYTACTLFSVTMYLLLPAIVYLWTKEPVELWVYMDVTRRPVYIITFLRQALAQAYVGLALGQLGVFFAVNSILLCGQLDLLCCSLRNARYTALLRTGVAHQALEADLVEDERHQHLYNRPEMEDSLYDYDEKVVGHSVGKIMQYDLYSPEFESATVLALRQCARMGQVATAFKLQFQRFVSPLLVLRVVQVTMYLCTLLYAATLKFEMVTVEYLMAVALDIFVYCYFGNQIILQADRVSTAAYQSGWPAAGARARRLLLNLQLANKRPAVVRAGNFLPMDLHTFVVIIKTSFSYYTLLVNVNEKKS